MEMTANLVDATTENDWVPAMQLPHNWRATLDTSEIGWEHEKKGPLAGMPEVLKLWRAATGQVLRAAQCVDFRRTKINGLEVCGSGSKLALVLLAHHSTKNK
jgi:hypothetical protein